MNSLRESVLKQQEAFHKARERLEQDTNRVSTLRDNLEIHVETIKQKESTLEKRYYTLVGLELDQNDGAYRNVFCAEKKSCTRGMLPLSLRMRMLLTGNKCYKTSERV